MKRATSWMTCVMLALVALAPIVMSQEPLRSILEAQRIRAIIDDLRDDEVRWNAHRAMDRLDEIGEPAVPYLEEALDSDDHQQRQLAAGILMDLDRWEDIDYEPSGRLLEVLVEGLRHDQIPRETQKDGSSTFTGGYNAKSGVHYLLTHAQRAQPYLVAAMDSQDEQQRFLAAFVLGMSGSSRAVNRVIDVLLPHLGDNNIGGDGMMAAAALYRLGPVVVPRLRQSLPQADRQHRDLVNLILLDLRSPPLTEEELRARKSMHRVTDLYHDPLVQYRFGMESFGALNKGRVAVGEEWMTQQAMDHPTGPARSRR